METPDLDNPRLWRMALELSPGVLHAVITSTVADSSLVYRRLPLDNSLPLHKALEEIVYATPELLEISSCCEVRLSPYYLVFFICRCRRVWRVVL